MQKLKKFTYFVAFLFLVGFSSIFYVALNQNADCKSQNQALKIELESLKEEKNGK